MTFKLPPPRHKINKFVKNLICCFIPSKKLRKRIRSTGKISSRAMDSKLNNKVIVVDENGVEHVNVASKVPAAFNIMGSGRNNTVRIRLPILGYDDMGSTINIFLNSDDNTVMVGGRTRAHRLDIHMEGAGHNRFEESGCNCIDGHVSVEMTGYCKAKIGIHCMFAGNIVMYFDGHAVIDEQSRECINMPPEEPLTIGNHVWVGRNAVLLKHAGVPNNSIVAYNATVTKKFLEPNVVLAGNPAKVVKTGINWVGDMPMDYRKN